MPPPGPERRITAPPIGRRLAGRMLGAGVIGALLAGCGKGQKWHAVDVSGLSPPLAFALTRASDGKLVTEADYRGGIALLYFGYTFCPDVCPTTLADIAEILGRLGADAAKLRVLFLTVDPDRDTLPVLADYAGNFGPQFDGLRGTADAVLALARRYRLVYSVSPATADHPYEVSHSSAVYVFDKRGRARLLIASLATDPPDIGGVTADLRRLAREA